MVTDERTAVAHTGRADGAAYAVIGGGISGLAAAWELAQHVDPRTIHLLEATDRCGGRLRVADVGGLTVDVGAESMLARRPEGVDLVDEAGLGDRLTRPASVPAAVLVGGRLRPLPARTMMGVPSGPDGLAELLTAAELDRFAHEQITGPIEVADISVGDLVEARLGPAIVDRLVEPLLAGVYAGDARRISLRAAVPQLWPAAVGGLSLVRAVADLMNHPESTGGTQHRSPAERAPAFAGYLGGMGSLAGDLARRLTGLGVRIECDARVTALARAPGGRLRVTVSRSDGGGRSDGVRDVAGVILAVPASAAARLAADLAPRAATELSRIELASMAVVTFVFDRAHVPVTGRSGVLVPPTEGLRIKACTFSSEKWPWLAEVGGQRVVVRASIGRAGDAAALHVDDAELTQRALVDLRSVLTTAGHLGNPRAAHVQRWGGGLPQYAVGHLDAVERIRRDLIAIPQLAVTGGFLDGVGVPACVGTARRQARELLARLAAAGVQDASRPDSRSSNRPSTCRSSS